jgi:BCD family chlorophyll transporter-like MFS transporter
VQTTAAGLAIAFGGIARDLVSTFAVRDGLGLTLAQQATGYGVIYAIEIALLLATLVLIGPLVGALSGARAVPHAPRFGLTEFPT